MKKLLIALLLSLAVLSTGDSAAAQERVEQFQVPDVRDDFCGLHIGFQYCRCAFHNEETYCRSIQMDQSGARRHVMAAFEEWVAARIETFALNCIRNGGLWDKNRRTCTYPDPNDPPQSIQERYGLPDMTGRPRGSNISIRPVGKVVKVTSCNVFIYMAAFERWKGPVQGGQDLYQDDVLITRGEDGCTGGAGVTLFSSEGQDTLDIAPDTWLEFPRPIDPSDQGILADLKRGAMRFYDLVTGNQQPAFRSPFNVRTPTVVTGRRGTEFMVSYNEETGVSEVLVLDGEVYVQPNGEETTVLGAGEQLKHDSGGIMVSDLSPSDWNAALGAHGLSGEHITVPAEDLIPPIGPPVEFTRAELVGDLSFLDSQFGGSGFPAKPIFVGLLVAAVVALMAGLVVFAPMLLLPPEQRLRR